MDILICDDEPLAVERLSRMVTQLGHHVVATAEHGKQAIDFVQQYEPDVVLLDIRMPEMDGLARRAAGSRARRPFCARP